MPLNIVFLNPRNLVSTKTLLLKHYYHRQGIRPNPLFCPPSGPCQDIDQKRPFVHNSVRNFSRVCSQFWLSVRTSA